jgi:hypothetical protein
MKVIISLIFIVFNLVHTNSNIIKTTTQPVVTTIATSTSSTQEATTLPSSTQTTSTTLPPYTQTTTTLPPSTQTTSALPSFTETTSALPSTETTTTLIPSTQTIEPTTTQTTRNNINYDNFCGDINNVYCAEPCPTGQNSECINPGRFCIYAPSACKIKPTNGPNFSVNNYCGPTFDMLNCSQTCYSGKSSECLDPTYSCYNAPDGCVINKSSQITVGILSVIFIGTAFFLL